MMSTVVTDIIELQAVYGFKAAVPIDLEVVDNDWLETHCDIVGYARLEAPIELGLWLSEGYEMEISATHLVASDDPRATKTLAGPVSYQFPERSN